MLREDGRIGLISHGTFEVVGHSKRLQPGRSLGRIRVPYQGLQAGLVIRFLFSGFHLESRSVLNRQCAHRAVAWISRELSLGLTSVDRRLVDLIPKFAPAIRSA